MRLTVRELKLMLEKQDPNSWVYVESCGMYSELDTQEPLFPFSFDNEKDKEKWGNVIILKCQS